MRTSAVPSGYTVTGIDVSSHDHTSGDIDWTGLHASGTAFAYIKATEATTDTWYVNPYLAGDTTHEADYQDARNVGMYVGAYAFGRPDIGVPEKQADFLVDNSLWTADSQTLVPMLDIEAPYFSGPDSCWNLTPAQLVAWIQAFGTEVEHRIGRKPMIYTAATWWTQCTGSDTSFDDYPLDVGCWTTNPACTNPPALPSGWSTFAIWQYAGGNPSQQGNYDKEVVNGDINALKALAGSTPPVVVSLHSHANGRIVTAESAGAKSLVANRTGIGTWEQFDEIDLGGGNVALRSHANGHFVTAENGGARPLIANRTAVGSWERFTVYDFGGGHIALLAQADGRFVTAESAGAKPLIANRLDAGSWETFTLTSNPDGSVSLRADVNGRYVTAENAGALPLIANRTAIGGWEEFDLS